MLFVMSKPILLAEFSHTIMGSAQKMADWNALHCPGGLQKLSQQPSGWSRNIHFRDVGLNWKRLYPVSRTPVNSLEDPES